MQSNKLSSFFTSFNILMALFRLFFFICHSQQNPANTRPKSTLNKDGDRKLTFHPSYLVIWKTFWKVRFLGLMCVLLFALQLPSYFVFRSFPEPWQVGKSTYLRVKLGRWTLWCGYQMFAGLYLSQCYWTWYWLVMIGLWYRNDCILTCWLIHHRKKLFSQPNQKVWTGQQRLNLAVF